MIISFSKMNFQTNKIFYYYTVGFSNMESHVIVRYNEDENED